MKWNVKGTSWSVLLLGSIILFGAGYFARRYQERPRHAVQELTAERAAHIDKIRSIDQQLITEYAKLDSLYSSRPADPDSAARALLERYRAAGYLDTYGSPPVDQPNAADHQRTENMRRSRQINGLLNAKIQTLIAETSRQETEINDAQQGLKEETARRSVMERRAKRRGNVVLVETLVIAAAIVTKFFYE
ncbi:hypothetical protein [Salmonirosea aquatica]|uniref:Uncharacterized protein n=1 Tax=Salmonirosea aquatica TaxID=2654236 RepID=A0A7C9BVY3_9BACT|nr:hypothetical protein [Cytophagaceae bacterium SJW1-29]